MVPCIRLRLLRCQAPHSLFMCPHSPCSWSSHFSGCREHLTLMLVWSLYNTSVVPSLLSPFSPRSYPPPNPSIPPSTENSSMPTPQSATSVFSLKPVSLPFIPIISLPHLFFSPPLRCVPPDRHAILPIFPWLQECSP